MSSVAELASAGRLSMLDRIQERPTLPHGMSEARCIGMSLSLGCPFRLRTDGLDAGTCHAPVGAGLRTLTRAVRCL